MIFIIIGQSGSGKTTFVRKRFLTGELSIVEDIVPYTTNGEYCAIGKYGIGIRTEGTDTLSYDAGEKIRRQIRKLQDEGKNVVIEGDRINNRATFATIALMNAPTKLFLVDCSLETSLQRLRAAGSKITPTFVKATKTRSRNNFLKWRKRFDGEVVRND